MNAKTSIPINPLDTRKTALPAGRPDLLEQYKTARRLNWVHDDISLVREYESFKGLGPDEQKIVKYILGFFSNSDKLVNDNIEGRFENEIDIYEAKVMYNWQKTMEDEHNITYSLLLNEIIRDPVEQDFYSNASINIASVKAMADWIENCLVSDEPFSTRLLRMMIVEGVFFVSCFTYIYWLAAQGKMPGLSQSNEFIARDEWIHTCWGATLYNLTTIRPSRAAIEQIARAGVALAVNFATEILEGSSLNIVSMRKHIEEQMDKVLSLVGQAPVFNSKSEFLFMMKAKMPNQTDFFHRQPTEYTTRPTIIDTGEINIEF